MRARGEECVQRWRSLHIYAHTRMCALVCLCEGVRGVDQTRARVCVRDCVCVYLLGFVVLVCGIAIVRVCFCIYVCARACWYVCLCVFM